MAERTEPDFPFPLKAPEADRGHAMRFGADQPLALDCGKALSSFTLAYQSYGALNAARGNAVLICHALSGDQFVASRNPVTGRNGWWASMVGPGKPIDTDRFFVLCINVLGGCMGSTGPASIDPSTDEIYARRFPVLTIADMVRAQALLLDELGIEKLLCVTGGSMGGMQALEWLAQYPSRVRSAIPIACAAHHTAQNIALHEVGRQAVMADADWLDGDYAKHGKNPRKGLAVARMAAHVTYLSEAALERKFGRALQQGETLSYGFEADFQAESYLRHQGRVFTERFDANSYLYITRAMDYFDLAAAHGGELAEAFRGVTARVQGISFSGDWLFPTAENRRIADALKQTGADARFIEIESDKGHDAFLLDEPVLFATMREFLNEVAAANGV